jgi:hypothetical protein
MIKKWIKRYDIELHNEIRWILEDYIGEYDNKRKCVDAIIDKIKTFNSGNGSNLLTEEKRREEILKTLPLNMSMSVKHEITSEIISQEKSMIEQAKKEAREEFAEKVIIKIQERRDKENFFSGEISQARMYGFNISIQFVDELLKEYEEEI